MAASSSSFQPILDAALVNYREQTKVDLTKHPSAEKIQNCSSLDDILQLLLERESAFNVYRDKHRKLIDSLRPIVQVVHAFSSICAEAAGLVRDQHSILFVCAYSYVSLQTPFQPTKAIFVGIDVLLSVRVTLLPVGLLCPIYLCQAAVGVGESYDALDDLFERVANFLTRFHVYTEKIPQSPTMSNIMVKIMTEVLSVLALATKHINQGRFSKWPIICRSSVANRGIEKFMKRLLGERRVEATLQRLDRLTQEEGLMTGVRTLEVVHGLSDDLKVVRDGKKPFLTGNQTTNATYWSRRKGFNAWCTTSRRYVRPV
jgi:hypothetical protein